MSETCNPRQNDPKDSIQRASVGPQTPSYKVELFHTYINGRKKIMGFTGAYAVFFRVKLYIHLGLDAWKEVPQKKKKSSHLGVFFHGDDSTNRIQSIKTWGISLQIASKL